MCFNSAAVYDGFLLIGTMKRLFFISTKKTWQILIISKLISIEEKKHGCQWILLLCVSRLIVLNSIPIDLLVIYLRTGVFWQCDHLWKRGELGAVAMNFTFLLSNKLCLIRFANFVSESYWMGYRYYIKGQGLAVLCCDA